MAEDPKRSETFDETGPIASALGHHEVAAVGILLALALLFRILRWSATAVMFNDGPVFIALAQAFADGEWARALGHKFHPLYPLLTAAFHSVIRDWELAAVAVNAIGGTAAVGCLYGFARAAFGRSAAFAAAAILAVHPHAIEFSGDVQSEGLYLGFFLGGVWALWIALRGSSPRAALVAGLLSGLAYLTRPEGIGLLLVGGSFAAWYALRRSWSRRRAAAWVTLLLLGTAVTAGPYVAWLRMETGAWSLTQKKSVGWVLGISEPDVPFAPQAAPPPAKPGDGLTKPATPGQSEAAEPKRESVKPAAPSRLAPYLGALSELIRTGLRAIRFEVLAVLVAGALIGRWRWPSPRGQFVLVILGLYALVLFELALNVRYVSARHTLPPLTAAFGHLGAALLTVAGAFSAPRRGIVVALVFGVIAGIGLSKSLSPDRTDSLAERRAAEWLRAQDLSPRGVAVHRRRIAYYAGSPDVKIPSKPFRYVVEEIRQRGADYLIVNEEDSQDYPWLVEELPTRARLLHREAAHGQTASVYLLLQRKDYPREPAARRP